MFAPYETDSVLVGNDKVHNCSDCKVCAATIAQQAQLITELQARLVSQQQELSSKEFIKSMYQ